MEEEEEEAEDDDDLRRLMAKLLPHCTYKAARAKPGKFFPLPESLLGVCLKSCSRSHRTKCAKQSTEK